MIGLQEVAARFRGRGAVDQLAHLARATGFEAVAGPTLHLRTGHCGNGLLTRRLILAVRRLDLSLPGREPRGALDVQLAVGDAVVRVVVTHLGLRWRDRRAQVARLLGAMGEDRATPLVLLGDLNEWLPRLGCLARLHARLGASPAWRTFPARRPLLALDRILVQPRAALVALRAHRTALARVASDHLPLRATAVWSGPGPAAA